MGFGVDRADPFAMATRTRQRNDLWPANATAHGDAAGMRDPAPDAYRALALTVVVIGHWLLAVTFWTPAGDLHASNLLELAPWTQWITWVAQPVPLFFVVGGWASARSWRSTVAQHPSSGDAGALAREWRTARLQRLLLPVRTFVLSGLALGLVLTAIGGRAGNKAARLLGMPLWFLAVYVPVTLSTPLLVSAVRRWSWRVPATLAALTVATDLARFALGLGWVGWLNFVFVWWAMASLGAACELRPPNARRVAAVTMLTFGALWAVVALGWYPVSMVGVGNRSNNTPPTLALALLGTVHAGLAWLGAPALRRALRRRRRTAASVNALGAVGMHLYLWHLCATVVVVGVQFFGPLNIEPVTGGWWAARPVWLAALALAASPVIAAAVTIDRGRLQRLSLAERTRTAGHATNHPSAQGWAMGAAATLGLAVLSLGGFAAGWSATAAVAAIVWAGRNSAMHQSGSR